MNPILFEFLEENPLVRSAFFAYRKHHTRSNLKKVQKGFLDRCLREKVLPKTLLPKCLNFTSSNPFPDLHSNILTEKIRSVKEEIKNSYSISNIKFHIFKTY